MVVDIVLRYAVAKVVKLGWKCEIDTAATQQKYRNKDNGDQE